MQHWLQLVTRSWRARPGRAALTVLSVTLGVSVVVWVTGCYESVRRAVTAVVLEWIGRSHVIIEPVEGVWAVFNEEVEPLVAKVPGVAQTTCRTREFINAAPVRAAEPSVAASSPAAPADRPLERIEITGVRPERERRFREYKLTAGRFLAPDDRGVVLMEELLARDWGLGVGDRVFIRHDRSPDDAGTFTIVGLVDRRRASVNQAPMVWAPLGDVRKLTRLPGAVKTVDLILSDPSVANIRRVAAEVQKTIDAYNARRTPGEHESEKLQVKTTEAQHQKLGAARALLQLIMLLLSCVVLLTAFFIILATMSMGVSERISELGLLRCVGVTRRQLATLVLGQTFALGAVGTALGLPVGILLQWLTIRSVPQYLGAMAYNETGIVLAILGGLGTTLLGAAIPAASALSVSPAEAVRALGRERSARRAWGCALVGVLLLGAHELIRWRAAAVEQEDLHAFSTWTLLVLYAGYALLAPIVVVAFGRLAVRVAAAVLRLSPQLLGEEIDRAPFRSAAICSSLMVGLSLIVGLVVWGQSVKEGWQFPREFPDALLYSYIPLPLDRVRALRDTPGIAQFTVTDDFAIAFKKPGRKGLLESLAFFEPAARFLAIDPEEGFRLVKLTFLEGSEAEATRKLKQGGHVLVTREYAQARGAKLGDKVRLWVDDRRATFTIAGIVASPGLDIAISFFNASEFFQFYAVGAVIGTLDDAERLFGRRYGKLMLMNFDFGRTGGAADAPRVQQSMGKVPRADLPPAPGGRPTFAMGPGPIPGDGPEERIANQMLRALGDPPKAFVTARELKQQIDRNINRVTLLLSAVPLVGLLISALGLANLMAANVASRARQIAVLRAIGLTRSQTLRSVIGEGLVLALLGSGLGLVLGMLLARTSNDLTHRLSGCEPVFAIPWSLVLAGAALATLLCVLAALVPARRAGRSNIVGALAST